MQTLKLNRISISNFKGAKSLSFDLNGQDATLIGKNEVGKTTVADAYCWLLYGKDAEGKATFEIKPLDQDNNPIHNLESTVEAEFDLGEQYPTTLKKVYREIWTKPRGKAQAENTGHTTDHFVNGVPLSEGEYKKKVAAIADEETLLMLTNPSYFAGKLPWVKARTMLLETFGDVSDADVIASKPELAPLTAILGQHTTEDYKKIATQSRKKLNDEIELIPVKISEASLAIPDLENKVRPNIAKIEDDLQAANNSRATVLAGGAVAEKTKVLREKEGELQDAKNQVSAMLNKDFEEAQQAVREVQSRVNSSDLTIEQTENKIKAENRQIAGLEEENTMLASEREAIRKAAISKNAETLEFSDEDVCASCGQPLPADKVAASREAAQATFNLEKSNALELLTEKTRKKKAQIEENEGQIAARKQEIAKLTAQLESLQKAHRDLGDEYDAAVEKANSLKAPTIDFDAYPAVGKIKMEMADLQAAISDLNRGSSAELAKADDQIANLNRTLASARATEAEFKSKEQQEARISTLEADQKRLAKELEKIDREINLIETFIRTKVSMLTDLINRNFEIVNFRLFKEQVNGGLQEECQPMVSGVPYGTGLNTGTKINAGLDIISAFSKAKALSLPVFVDNAESVTKILTTSGQQIACVHDASVRSLRFIPLTRDLAIKQLAEELQGSDQAQEVEGNDQLTIAI
jgi:DNA repair exonuclease SbcCD ATPase subunit